MAVESYATQLERVQAAIAKIEQHGQSWGQGVEGSQRNLTRADLAQLYEREKYLRRMVARETCGRRGFRVVRGIPR